jgi:hypothetical protein
MRLLTLLIFLVSTTALAHGAWFKNPSQIALYRSRSRDALTLAIVKKGVFNRRGKVTFESFTETAEFCGKPMARVAWITHRLSKGETLSKESGSHLGKELNRRLPRPCFTGVELDIEPLASPPPWLFEFLTGVRETLVDFRWSLAVPPVSTIPIEGFSWKPEEAIRVLEIAHGLDFMIYDTGSEKGEQYARTLKETLAFTDEASARFPGKSFVLGLPAYPDKTRLHRAAVENLIEVELALKTVPSLPGKGLCRPEVQWAVYAGWTMTATDHAAIERLSQWRKSLCQ